jgi:sucrose 6(F)-phosphate phosphorylase
VKNGPQLMTYPDSLGGGLGALDTLLRGPLSGMFSGVHVLPPFPSSGDRGFAPLTYREIDSRFGTWADLRRLAEGHDVELDLMANHLSRESPEFLDFVRHGRRSRSADLFITLDKVWPDGAPPAADVERIFLRKPEAPFSTITIEDSGERERIWTSFGSREWSEQIDIDVTSERTRQLITEWLGIFASNGARIVRLDAVGYVIKKAGTSCFMVEPEIYAFLDWVVSVAASMGLEVLPEVHDVYATHDTLAAHGYWTYDFVLPGLLLHSFETGSVERLATHLAASPARRFTMLDCHDGIPVQPDLDGILRPSEMLDLAAGIERRGGNVNRILSEAHSINGVDVHQLNCTYYSALDHDDDKYVAARAIQLFARGIPQVYHVGLLAGENDHQAVAETGEGRAINRHDYSVGEVLAALERPVVQRVQELIRLRRDHPAFGGTLEVTSTGRSIRLAWRQGRDECALTVSLSDFSTEIHSSGEGANLRFAGT